MTTLTRWHPAPSAKSLTLILAALALAACSPDNGDQKAATASNVTLTDAQKKNIRIFAVEPLSFRKTRSPSIFPVLSMPSWKLIGRLRADATTMCDYCRSVRIAL